MQVAISGLQVWCEIKKKILWTEILCETWKYPCFAFVIDRRWDTLTSQNLSAAAVRSFWEPSIEQLFF